MADEVVETLAPAAGSRHVDATLGGGGHAERILDASDPDGRLLGLDADGAAIARVRTRLEPRFGDRLRLRQANFRELGDRGAGGGLRARSTAACSTSGCRASSSPTRSAGSGSGRAARSTCASTPAAASRRRSCSRRSTQRELTALFRRYGEEPFAGRIARAIVEARRTAPIRTAEELAALVARVAPVRAPGRRRVHPATRVFQALRIAVNEELDALEAGLAAAVDLLRPGGRLVVLSYHSLEDRIVKRFLQAERRGCTCPPEAPVCVCGRQPRLRLLSPKGLVPSRPRSPPTPAPGAPVSAPPSGWPPSRPAARPRHRPARERRPGRDPRKEEPPMSKRHSTSRRRTYGRRQHELHERMDRRTERVRADRTWRDRAASWASTRPVHRRAATEPPFGFAD